MENCGNPQSLGLRGWEGLRDCSAVQEGLGNCSVIWGTVGIPRTLLSPWDSGNGNELSACSVVWGSSGSPKDSLPSPWGSGDGMDLQCGIGDSGSPHYSHQSLRDCCVMWGIPRTLVSRKPCPYTMGIRKLLHSSVCMAIYTTLFKHFGTLIPTILQHLDHPTVAWEYQLEHVGQWNHDWASNLISQHIQSPFGLVYRSCTLLIWKVKYTDKIRMCILSVNPLDGTFNMPSCGCCHLLLCHACTCTCQSSR